MKRIWSIAAVGAAIVGGGSAARAQAPPGTPTVRVQVTPATDPAVMPSLFGGHGGYAPSPQMLPPDKQLATPQGYPPAPQAQYAPAPQPAAPQMQYVPVMLQQAAPPQAAPTMVQLPSRDIVIQQSEPRVFLAQSQPVAAPTMAMVAVPANAPTASGNLFLSTTAPPQTAMMAVPSAAPTMMMAVPAPAQQPVMATLASPTGSGLGSGSTFTNQAIDLPATNSSSIVTVRGPGLFAAGLARLGERMTRLGNVRIISRQSTTLRAPSVQSGGAGTARIETATSAPVAPAQTTVNLAGFAPRDRHHGHRCHSCRPDGSCPGPDYSDYPPPPPGKNPPLPTKGSPQAPGKGW